LVSNRGVQEASASASPFPDARVAPVGFQPGRAGGIRWGVATGGPGCFGNRGPREASDAGGHAPLWLAPCVNHEWILGRQRMRQTASLQAMPPVNPGCRATWATLLSRGRGRDGWHPIASCKPRLQSNLGYPAVTRAWPGWARRCDAAIAQGKCLTPAGAGVTLGPAAGSREHQGSLLALRGGRGHVA